MAIEIIGHHAYRVVDKLETLVFSIIVHRNDDIVELIAKVVDFSDSSLFIRKALFGLRSDSPICYIFYPLVYPQAYKHTKIHDSFMFSLPTACIRCFVGTNRNIQPDVNFVNHFYNQVPVLIFQ